MLINSFLFGDYERYSQAGDFFELLLKNCVPDKNSLIKVVGSLIRLLSYKKTDVFRTL